MRQLFQETPSGPPPCRNNSNSSGDSARCMATGIFAAARVRRLPPADRDERCRGRGGSGRGEFVRRHTAWAGMSPAVCTTASGGKMRFGQFHGRGDAIGGRGDQFQERRDLDRRSRNRAAEPGWTMSPRVVTPAREDSRASPSAEPDCGQSPASVAGTR